MKLTTDLIKRQTPLREPSNDSPYEWIVEFNYLLEPGDNASMPASEQMFFLGAPLSHVVHYEEEMKKARQREEAARRPILARLS